MKILILKLLIFYPSTLISIRNVFIQNGIYYKAPAFSVKNTNVTFGVTRPLIMSKSGEGTAESFSETLVSICQAELINKKKAQISIDGIINLVFQDFYDPRSSGQEAILNILSNNLYYTANDSQINPSYSVNLTGFFSVSSFGTAKVNSFITNDFGLPFIISGDLGRPSEDNQFSGSFPSQNVTFAQVLNTFRFNTFNAVLAILKHFNWTLVANLFEADTYGYNRQQSVLDYSSQNSLPIFTCGFIYGIFKNTANDGTRVVDVFCRCVNSKPTINVIVLWMSTGTAYSTIKALKESCSAAKKWTFIITDDVQSPVSYTTDTAVLNNSLLLRNNGPWDFKSFVQNCQEYASPEAKTTINSLLQLFYEKFYKCQYEKEDDVPTCPESLAERISLCACTYDEFSQDPYVTKFLYTADVINVYAAAISLIQNNCTFLNENRYISNLSSDFPDFCTATHFGPLQLSYAMRFVNFTGYTGVINFLKEVLIRATKSYYLYSVYNTTIDATLVGYINDTGTTIYNNLVNFVNDEIPIAEIVPQNPDLSYAVVDVFFGVGIFEFIVCLILLAFFIIHRDDRAIRQSAPLVTLTLLIGVTGLALTQILLSFARTDALCTINLYLFRLGLNLILMSLLVKNYRIYKIFTNKKATAVYITESRLLLYIGITTLLYIIVLTTFVAIFGYDAVLEQSEDNQFYQYINCSLTNKTWDEIFLITLDVIIFLQVIASLILAWLTRKVQSEYRESRVLAAFSTIIFVALIIFIPLSYTLRDSTDSQILRYVIIAEFLTVAIFSAFALLFIPIVWTFYVKINRFFWI